MLAETKMTYALLSDILIKSGFPKDTEVLRVYDKGSEHGTFRIILQSNNKNIISVPEGSDYYIVCSRNFEDNE